MDDNSEFAGKNPLKDSSNAIATSALSLEPAFDFNIECHDFQMEDTITTRRESLGIIDFNYPDFRRDSMSFLYKPRKFDDTRTTKRESLGIIDLNDPVFHLEPIPFLCEPENDDFGRQLLEILNFNDDWRIGTNLTMPQITVTDLSCDTRSYSPSNVAFLSNSTPLDDSALSFNFSSSQIESCDKCALLDPSMKSRSNNSEKAFSPKIFPRKFVNSYQKTWVKESSIGSNCSVSSNEKSLGDLRNVNKFKARKVEEEENLRRGPMKTMIPVTKMALKKRVQVTPTRIESHLLKHTPKRTSTPQMARSTPGGPPNSVSPLSRHSTNYRLQKYLV